MSQRPQHARDNRQVPRSRILAQSGVPLLLCSAVLVVLAYNSQARTAHDGGGPSGDGTRLTRDAAEAARAALEELQAYALAHPDAAVEIYQRARPYVASREPEVAAAAARLCDEALVRFDPALRGLLERAAALEAEGRDLEAVRLYEEFLARPAVERQVELLVRERRVAANGRIQDRHARDGARVRQLLAQGARAEAEALVEEMARYSGPHGERTARALLSEAAAVTSAALVQDVVVDAALLGRALRGQVTPREGGAVAVRYGFDDEAELEDWWTSPQYHSGPLQPGHFEALEPAGRPAWYVAEGVLVGDGWTRRSLLVDFRLDRPVTVEALVRGERNRVVSLGLLQGRGVVAGSGWCLDLPLERVPHRTSAFERAVLRCRARGPAIALAREERFLELAELAVVEEPPREQSRVVLELRPAGDAHTLTLQVGERRLEPVTVELDRGPLRVFLPALGAPVAWEEVVVTGVPSTDIALALASLGRSAGVSDAALRGRLLEHLRRRRPGVQLR